MAGSSLLRVFGAQQAISALKQVRDAYANDVVYVVGVGAEYGAFVEFGTSRSPAQPYLFPAVNHVMTTKFDAIAAEASSKSNPTEHIVSSLALEIEREAKKRAPVDTGHLKGSIEAFPVKT